MSEPYVSSEGGAGDIVSTDPGAVTGELNSIVFEINSTESNYSPETKITSYIGNIFKAFDKAKESFENVKSTAISYQDKVEIVVDPDSPIQTSVFDEYLSPKATVNITGGNLNVRSLDGEIVGKLQKGAEVKIKSYNPEEEWTLVEIDGEERYVATRYLQLNNENIAISAAATSTTIGSAGASTSSSTPTTDGTASNGGTLSTSSSNDSEIPSSNASSNSGTSTSNSSEPVTSANNIPIDLTGKEAIVNIKNDNSSLNIRLTPDKTDSSNIIGRLKQGSSVKVLEYNPDGWSKISYDDGPDGIAYVYSKYLK